MTKITYTPLPLVAPSILSADFAFLAEALSAIENAGADWVHIDVMDGHFVPNLTIGPPVIKNLRKHSRLPFDVHLMIEKPERYIKEYRDAGADIITVHAEACPHLHRTLTHIRELGALAGVSLNPATQLFMLDEILDSVDLILLMSVNPGFGGQAFIPQTLDKLKRLKAMLEERPVFVEVDGGITTDNAKQARQAGAQVLVAGSAVFCAKDPMQTVIQKLRESNNCSISCAS